MLICMFIALLCLVAQLCPILFHPLDCSPPDPSVPEIFQAGILEWVAISFSNAWKKKVKVKSLSRVRLIETPWTAAYQAPPSMGFSRQEYWSGVPLPSLDTSIKMSLPGSSVPGILQARHWSGLPFPSPMHACTLSHFSSVQLCATLWTAAHQAPLSTGFSRQEY